MSANAQLHRPRLLRQRLRFFLLTWLTGVGTIRGAIVLRLSLVVPSLRSGSSGSEVLGVSFHSTELLVLFSGFPSTSLAVRYLRWVPRVSYPLADSRKSRDGASALCFGSIQVDPFGGRIFHTALIIILATKTESSHKFLLIHVLLF